MYEVIQTPYLFIFLYVATYMYSWIALTHLFPLPSAWYVHASNAVQHTSYMMVVLKIKILSALDPKSNFNKDTVLAFFNGILPQKVKKICPHFLTKSLALSPIVFLLLSTVLHVDHGKQPTTRGRTGALLNLP